MSPLPMRAEDGGWLVLSLAFALGACIGSFLNVCIYRLPQDESVLRPASRCPGCGTPIAWRDNIPLLSWFLLGARCRACRASIPARYPLVEAATGALAVLALVAFGPSPAAAVAFLFTAALLLITFVDLDHRFIPDEVSLPGIVVGLGAAFLPGGIGPLGERHGVRRRFRSSCRGSCVSRRRRVAGECRTRRPARRHAAEEAGYAARTRLHAARGGGRSRPGHGARGRGRRPARRSAADGAARRRGTRGGDRAQARARRRALGRRLHRGPLRCGARAVRDARPGGRVALDALAAPGCRLRGPPRAQPRPLRRARQRRERHHHARGGRADAQRDREPAWPREGPVSRRATARRPRAGFSVVEALVGAALAAIALAGLAAVAGLATASLRLACGARGEAEDPAQLALEALTFDVRRAGWDPAASGLVAVREADADRLVLAADLDGDGAVDDTSEETTAYVCLASASRLSRLVGRQSMPLADGVTGCGFRYLDRDGVPMAIPAGGLGAAARARIAAVALDLVLLPNGLAGRAERSILIALRTAP